MIQFSRFTLANGLRLLVHEDISTPMAAVCLLYDVGARDEHPGKTGFAHLFEHLMFSGSENAPDYDDPVQNAGGENNASTNNDLTNFYVTLPADNLETAFWLESDRMKSLVVNEKKLDVQRKVVVEEFKETTLNEPYGDVWHYLSALAYKVHPYRWPTIGLVPEHVENATLADVKDFYRKHYLPNNAILTVTGNIKTEEVRNLVEKWFGDIPAGNVPPRNLPAEPPQESFRQYTREANVPLDAIYIAFHAPGRTDASYFTADLLSDVLSNGDSSRLYRRLLKEQRIFTQIDAYITGSIDPGLFIIEGKPAEGISLETAETAIWKELEELKSELVPDSELQKLKNKVESALLFGEAGALNKAMNLAYYELIGDADMINREVGEYQRITPPDLLEASVKIFRKENCSTLYYKAKK